MTPKELEMRLWKHTVNEDRYLQGWKNPNIEQSMEEVRLNGQNQRILRLKKRTVSFDGSKHARFLDYPVHIHPWVEFNYMYSGSCIQHINGVPVELKQGQMILMDQNTVHDVPVLGENDILLNLFIGKQSLTADFFNNISQQNLISRFLVNSITEGVAHDNFLFFASENSRRLRLYVQEFFCEVYDPSEFSFDIMKSLFALIITELIQTYNDSLSFHDISSGRSTSVLPILKYIQLNYQTITLKSAAEHFNLNPNYLSDLLKTRTGQSFLKIVQQQRIATAKQLLTNSDLSVTEVAHLVGYENTTFFYKKFRQETGCSPNDYRTEG